MRRLALQEVSMVQVLLIRDRTGSKHCSSFKKSRRSRRHCASMIYNFV
jgi:hypothetical protein